MARYDSLPRAIRVANPPPPHLEEGQYIRWTTPDRIYEGQIVEVVGAGTRMVYDPVTEEEYEVPVWPGIKIQWMGQVGVESTFPVLHGYFPPQGTGLEIIPKPRSADRIARDARAGVMTVKRAAALLGVEPKRVRAMLRGGLLRGGQVEGKWVSVNGEDVMARLDE